MASKTANKEIINIEPLKKVETTVRIVGDSPLIVHAWSEKAKRMMLESQQGKTKGKKKSIRNPVDDFIQAAYWIEGKPEYAEDASEEECAAAFEAAIEGGARFGFPATAIKQAAQSAAYRLGWVKNQMGLRGAFFILPDSECNESSLGLVEIHSDTPVMREDLVRVGMGTADLRYRPQFNNWWMDLRISYNASSEFSLPNIINALNAGGYVCGIGEWRPERDGTNGQFHVATSAE